MPCQPKRNNAQHQPLTTVLRNIIREYPAGGGVLRELCQNADDSGATELVFRLDPNTHTETPLLHSGLVEFQGPSLLAYNNSTFSEKDFQSLSRIGDSGKAHDLTSTGKFGRGFNSVYNWTDGPIILSGSSLLLLDPHETWSREVSQPGGPMYDFVESCNEPEMINQLVPFRPIVENISQPFDGTVIRIPLRTASQALTTKILDLERNPTKVADLKSVFEKFATEMAESLLFLRHITSITLKIGDEDYAQAIARKYDGETDITESFSLDEPFNSVLVNGDQSTREESYKMDVHFTIGGEKQLQQYAVTHHFRDKGDDFELNSWARKYKLMPWVAIASPLQLSNNQQSSGRLFNILPLPVPSHQPAHIHALFSVRPDRATIHSGDDSVASEESETGKGSRWNQWLFEECIVDAWISNLEFISHLFEDHKEAGWKHWPIGQQAHEGTHLGSGTLGRVFERVLSRGQKLIPTISGSLTSGSDMIFAEKLESSLETALLEAGLIVVCPPNDRAFELAKTHFIEHGIRLLTPQSMRAALNALSCEIEDLSASSRSTFLDYIISDRSYGEIGRCSAPLLPMMNGTYCGFTRSKTGPRIRFNKANEADIFSQCSSFSIDSSKLSPKTLLQFTNEIDRLVSCTNIHYWDLEGAVWYAERYTFALNRDCLDDIISINGLAEWVDKLWIWGITAYPGAFMAAAENLWLLPLCGDRFRKIHTSSKGLVLDISGHGDIASTLRPICQSSKIGALFPILSTGVSNQVLQELKYGGCIADCDVILDFISWLHQNPNFFESIDDASKSSLVRHIGRKIPQDLLGPDFRKLRYYLRALPIFRLAFKDKAWSSLDDEQRTYVAVSTRDGQHSGAKLPYISLRNTTFIERDDPGVTDILRIPELAFIPSQRELLENYYIPTISHFTGGPEYLYSLAEYILESGNIEALSSSGRESLSGIDFITVSGNRNIFTSPKNLVDSGSIAAKFFYPDENVFPETQLLERFRASLERLHMVSTLTPEIILGRLEAFSKRREPDLSARLQLLLTQAHHPPLLSAEHLSLRWIPATDTLGERVYCNSYECRDRLQSSLVKYAMPMTDLEIGSLWQVQLGWKRPVTELNVAGDYSQDQQPRATPPEPRYVIKQLEEAVNRQDNSVIASLLKSGWLKSKGVDEYLDSLAWIPGKSGGYYLRSDVFFEEHGTIFQPYLDVIQPHFKKYFHPSTQTYGGVSFALEKSPGFGKLKRVLDSLSTTGKVQDEDLKVFVSVLETIALDFTKERSLRTIKIPDTEGSLHNFEEMTSGAGAHLDSYSDDPSIICMHFLHPSITPRAIRKLGIPTLQDRFLERMAGAEFIQDFEQEEDFMTLIDDTLRRYPLATTFREYLANAEDCGTATKISWVSDTTPAYPKMSLITNRLADCHGPALLCYNDGVFTEKDFSAVIKIGIGSKRDEPSKIGRFGRGSLTMYHWTMCPCFVSGQYFVIFDPQQKRLPKNPQTGKRRKGMKLALKDVRMNWPDQLKPFEGLFGFTSESEFFHGTLFRFPVMDTKPKTLIHSLLGSVMDTKLKTSIHPLYDPALALGKYRLEGDAYCSLIFLRNINSIECFKRDLNRGVAQEPDWSISRSIYDTCHSGPYTIEGIGFEFLSAAMPAIPTNFEKRWVVVRFEIPGGSIPDGVRNTQKDERLQASCAVASPISLGKPKIGTGRLFLTLPTENVLDLPVFISADLVIQSDRRGLPLHDEHGAEWNYWILEYGVAEAYIKLLHHLTRNPGSDPTHIWPKYHSKPSTLHSKSPIDDIISNALWKKVILDGNYSGDIFRAHSSVDGISVVSPSRSCFNLLDGPIRGLMDELLPIIIPDDNDWELVSSEGDLLSSLRELTQSHGTTAVRTITPTLVLDLLRDRSDCSRPLRDIWGDRYGLKLGFLNTLLEFLSQGGANAMRMIGCNILPLANCDLGKLGKKGGSDFLLPPNSGGIMDGQLLNVLPEFLVHPGLDPRIVKDILVLNVSHLDFCHIPRLVAALGTKEAAVRRTGLSRIWKCFDLMDDKKKHQVEAWLIDMPTIFTVNPKNPGGSKLITLREFNSGLPIILDVPTTKTEVLAMINLFDGVSFIDSNTLPRSYRFEETLDKPRGLRRLLVCIGTLASRSGMDVESYVRASLAGDTNAFSALRNAVRYCDWRLINSSQGRDLITSVNHLAVLRHLPIIRSGHDHKQLHWLSADKALLAPGKSLDLRYIPSRERFVDEKLERLNDAELKILGLSRMPISEFLGKHTTASRGRFIAKGDLGPHVVLLKWLCKEFPSALSNFPVAIDGNRFVCMANALYDHENPTFRAAFDHENEARFLHPLLRGIPWTSTIKTTNSANHYLDCAEGIKQQGEESFSDAFWLRSGEVFDFLKWDTHEVRTLCRDPSFYSQITHIPFVRCLQVSEDQTFRSAVMRGLIPKSRLITLLEGIISSDMALCWSQTPFFLEPPGAVVLSVIPGHGRPSSSTVISHLVVLAQSRHSISKTEIEDHIHSAKECYRYLQALRLSSVSIPAGEPIWFNTDEKSPNLKEFQAAWVCTKELCHGLEYDCDDLKRVRSSLNPFIELLEICHVPTLKEPQAPPAEAAGPSYSSEILSQFSSYRKNQLYVDVEITAGDRIFGVHRVVLCAASEYFARMFSAGMQEAESGEIELFDTDKMTVEWMLDYIYTGEMTPITASNDPTDEMERLLALLEISNRLFLPGLMRKLERALCSKHYIRPETVRSILGSAVEYRARDLETQCRQYIERNRAIIDKVGDE